MRTRRLGKTGLQVSEMSLGGLFLASFAAEYDQARATIRRALDLGVNYIDTAPGYYNSEEVLGKALEGFNGPLVLSTKLGGRPQPFQPQNRECLMQSVEDSLRLLKRDHIDILMIHEPDRPGQYDWWTDMERFQGPVLEVLEDLKKKGTIRFTGLGGTTAYEMPHIIRTGRFDVVLTAFNYSLLWREALHEVIPAAKEQGMGIVAGSALQQGGLSRRYDQEVRSGARWMSPPRRRQYQTLYALLYEVGMPLPEMAYRFVLSNPDISCVLMGARSPQEVEQNIAAAEKGPLPKDLLARLDEIAKMVPFRPYGEPFGLPFTWEHKGPGVA